MSDLTDNTGETTETLSASKGAEIAISCRDLRKIFTQGPLNVLVLNGINLEIARGERVAIVGASGSGKSTLLQLLGGLDEASAGSISILGHELETLNEVQRGNLRNRSIGFIYQFHHLLPEFTALENVAMPLLIRGVKQDKAYPRAAILLEQVGLSKRIDHLPSELSGGERQRVAVARALVTDPACVLADEPTGNLDRMNAHALFDLIQELNERLNTSFVVVTHDTELAQKMQRQLLLVDGMLREI
jgi:lipoprotein-releasing system ATP-binding protein